MKTILVFLAAAVAASLCGGCVDSNPTNEPSKQAIEDADKRRAQKIDEDPNMSPADKAKMKEMLHLNKGASPAAARADQKGPSSP